jgi:hypothetical protein
MEDRLMRLLPTVAVTLLAWGASPAGAEEDVASLLASLKKAVEPGGNPRAARAAWDQLVVRGPAALPRILDAMDTSSTALANWLRTAFDQIVAADLKAGGKGLDADALLAFVRNPKHHGRARRLALEVVDQLRPGTSDRLIPGWLDDAEFGPDAIDFVVKEADALQKKGDKEEATSAFRKAFAASRDLPQVKTTAARLRNLGQTVYVAEHIGFFSEWYVIGPFDAHGRKGFQTVYPPEKHVDLSAELDGKAGKVRWKRFPFREPAPPALPPAGPLINLREALGETGDAVGYAYTAFRVPAATVVEFRGAADDNLTVWVNGERVFGFEEYSNGVRFDRHRFRVKLSAGVNTVLVKVCQAPLEPDGPDANWEFLLRAVDETGKGITWPSALPAQKD